MALRLEVFETAQEQDRPELIVTDSGHLEEAKLASFEAGYSAGWEDAATALSTLQIENEKLRAELEQVKRERDAAIEAANGLDKMIGRAWGGRLTWNG